MINDFLSLNRLFAANVIDQLTGGRVAIQQFLPRQQLKMRAYFVMIDFWQQLGEELEKGAVDPKSLEKGGRVYQLFEGFQEKITEVFDAFEPGVNYSEEGLFERWRDGIGRLVNRAVLGARGAAYREMEYEFERFWTQFFQLVRKPAAPAQASNDSITEQIITIRASNLTKLKQFGLKPPFLDTQNAERQVLALKQKLQTDYLLPDPTISAAAANQSAEKTAPRMLPAVLIDAAQLFTQSLDGATLLKVYEAAVPDENIPKLDGLILQELDIELRYVLQVAIGISRILYQSLQENKVVQEWVADALPGEQGVIDLLQGGRSLAMIALSEGAPEDFLVNTPDNGLPELRYTPAINTEKDLQSYQAQLDTLAPLASLKNLPDLLKAAHFSAELMRGLPHAEQVIKDHFRQYDILLPIDGEEAPEVLLATGPMMVSINDLLNKIAFKPLWARDEAWLDRTVGFILGQVQTVEGVLKKLSATTLNSGEQADTGLLAEVADKLCMVYAYRSVMNQQEQIREILVSRLREQLYGRVTSRLDNIHTWVATSVVMNLKQLLMADLSSLHIGGAAPDQNRLHFFALDYATAFPDWDKAMDAVFVAPMQKKLALAFDLQLGNEFPGYKVLEDFNYQQDYDPATLRGVLGAFLQAVSDVLKG